MTRDLFRELYDEATALAIDVFDRGRTDHPCAHLVRDAYADPEVAPPQGWPGTWRRDWQLPETYWGEIEREPLVAFVGINPSILPEQACPRHGSSFDDWFEFYRNRLGPRGVLREITTTAPPLYRFYSDVIREAFGNASDVHTDAIICDAVHYKSRKPGPPNLLRAAIDHATSAPLTLALIRRARCRVVVLAGQEAIESLAPALDAEALPSTMGDCVGRWFQAASGLCIVPSYHRWDMRDARVVGNAVACALRGEPVEIVRSAATDRLTEADILLLMETRGLSVTRELKQVRGVDGRAQRCLYWKRSARCLPAWVDFSGFTVAHAAVRPVTDNGRVQGRLECAMVPREVAIEIVARAFDAL